MEGPAKERDNGQSDNAVTLRAYQKPVNSLAWRYGLWYEEIKHAYGIKYTWRHWQSLWVGIISDNKYHTDENGLKKALFGYGTSKNKRESRVQDVRILLSRRAMAEVGRCKNIFAYRTVDWDSHQIQRMLCKTCLARVLKAPGLLLP